MFLREDILLNYLYALYLIFLLSLVLFCYLTDKETEYEGVN
jgi:hypothetical protein